MTKTTHKTLIIDTLTQEYYCVPMAEIDRDGDPTAGPNDFPYWSVDVDEAYNFGGGYLNGKLAAENEMKFNDLTCDGTRSPEIVDNKGRILHQGYKITYNEKKGKYVARNGRKVFSSNTDLKILKLGIDAWIRNCELSDRIDATPEGSCANPNVVRTYEKDNRGGY